MIDENVRAKIVPILTPGETILWAEKPVIPYDKTQLLTFIVVIALVALPFKAIIEDVISRWGDQSFYGVFFLTLFILIGALWSLRRALLPKYECYALTNKHVIIMRDIFPKQTAIIPFEDIKNVKAKPQGRYSRIILTLHGQRKTGRYAGSLRFTPFLFFKIEGFILTGITQPGTFFDQLKRSYALDTNTGKS